MHSYICAGIQHHRRHLVLVTAYTLRNQVLFQGGEGVGGADVFIYRKATIKW